MDRLDQGTHSLMNRLSNDTATMRVSNFMLQSCLKLPSSSPQIAINAFRRSTKCKGQLRCFSESIHLQLATKKAAKVRPPSKPPMTHKHSSKAANIVISSPPRGPAAHYRSFADTLALRSSPTLLYQSPSIVVFTVASYAFGGFCLAYGGWNFYTTYLNAPEGLSKWVSLGMGAVCVAMSCFGTWMILGVRSMHHCCGAYQADYVIVSQDHSNRDG